MIWFKDYTIEQLNSVKENTIHASLDIDFSEIGENFLSGTMPVNERTKQPFGILHGGASVVLAESLGSVASGLIVDPSKHVCVGQQINASHIRPMFEGKVTGKASPTHIGKTTHIWNIDITNEANKLVCKCQLTMAILPKEKLIR